MKATVALVALLVATCAGAARAASLPVVIEGLNEAAKACGISESQLESVASRTLGNSPLQPDTTNAGGWLHVRVTVSQTGRNPCVAHISVQMKSLSHGGDLVFCNEGGGDYSAPKADFPLAVESGMEQSIKQCLGSLKY